MDKNNKVSKNLESMLQALFMDNFWKNCRLKKIHLQGVSCQNVISNLALREGRTDISEIQWHLFSRKLADILIHKLTIPKKNKKIRKN